VQRGYIKIWRKLEDSGLLQMPETLATMLFLILHATHKATKRGTKYGVIELERGQGILAIRVLAKDMKLSIQSIRTILVRLEKMEILTLKPTHAFSVYTIVNYNKYNDVPEQSTREATNEQHAANTLPTQEQELKHLSIKEKSISSPKGSRYPEDSILSAKWGNIALEIRSDWTNEDVRIEHDSFKDFWKAKPGKDGVKLDWLATWRNWCRNSRRKGGINNAT
jgi:hypothetical protein